MQTLPFQQGHKAYKEGKTYLDNPYTDRFKSSQWLEGWKAAQRIDEIRKKLDETQP